VWLTITFLSAFTQSAEEPQNRPLMGAPKPAILRRKGFDHYRAFPTFVGRSRCDGERRSTWVFRILLSHSRKAYAEAVFRQRTDSFLRCLENAFAHFAWVPKTLVIDNLRAAVKQPDWFDPELCPKMRCFAEHYGTAILQTQPLHAAV
jgi:transposase